jgi:4'-phosphopantetheinyl transferase
VEDEGSSPLAGQGGTRLFVVDDDGRWDAALLASYVGMLDRAERARHQGYLRDDDRRRFAVGRALLRAALSACAPRDPRDWVLVRERRGRLRIAPGQADGDLRFSLSHTAGLVVCLVSVGHDVGVDVEDCEAPTPPSPAWPRKLFSPAEALAVARLPPPERGRRAWELWTLKEAYLKALGVGLSVPLSAITFALEPGRPPVLRAAPAGLRDHLDGWCFLSHQATARHHVAIALPSAAASSARLVVLRGAPFTTWRRSPPS